ncbi:mCG141829, partial [Mus musculus]
SPLLSRSLLFPIVTPALAQGLSSYMNVSSMFHRGGPGGGGPSFPNIEQASWNQVLSSRP